MTTQARKAPPGGRTGPWWPSKYGPDDQAGALNEITPDKMLEAVRLVRQGRAYDLAHAKLCGATGAWVAPLAII